MRNKKIRNMANKSKIPDTDSDIFANNNNEEAKSGCLQYQYYGWDKDIKDIKDMDLFLLALIYLNFEQHIENPDYRKKTNNRLPVFESFAPS